LRSGHGRIAHGARGIKHRVWRGARLPLNRMPARSGG
jgi:hypothetical protein